MDENKDSHKTIFNRNKKKVDVNQNKEGENKEDDYKTSFFRKEESLNSKTEILKREDGVNKSKKDESLKTSQPEKKFTLIKPSLNPEQEKHLSEDKQEEKTRKSKSLFDSNSSEDTTETAKENNTITLNNKDTLTNTNTKTDTRTDPVPDPAKPKRRLNIKVIIATLAILGLVALGIFVFQSNLFVGSTENEQWNNAKDFNTEFFYQKYIQDYPDGSYTSQATKLINDLLTEEELANISPEDLSNSSFMGEIKFQNNDSNAGIMRLSIGTLTIKDEGDDTAYLFDCTINLGPIDQRKDLLGEFNSRDNSITFIEQLNDPNPFDISKGRVYLREGEIFIESVNPSQYWNVDKQD